MPKHFGPALVLTACTLVSGCDASRVAAPTPLVRSSTVAAVQLPGDGNGSKDIVQVFIQNPVHCGGGIMLTRTVEGWIQTNPLEEGGSDVQQITLYRVNYTFSNSAGETFVIRETGIDQLQVVDGVMILQVSGKTPRHTGIIRIDLATLEQTFEAGQLDDLPRNRACEALT